MIMEKSVAKENDQISQRLELQEVDSLVQTPRRNVEAAANRLVSIEMHDKSIHDLNDGFQVGQEHAEIYISL